MINWEWIDLAEVTSTNVEAKKYNRRIVVSAAAQTKGKARRGRTWVDMSGNLFVSINIDFKQNDLGKMVLITGVSVLETIQKMAEGDINVKLKWPNDVLVNDNKISGILLEKGTGDFWVIGIGVNIKKHPDIDAKEAGYAATSLKNEGIETDRITFLHSFMEVFDHNLTVNFDEIRKTWLNNVKGLNQPIKVKDEHFKNAGIFRGVDENGILIIETNDGSIKKIYAGDVFYE